MLKKIKLVASLLFSFFVLGIFNEINYYLAKLAYYFIKYKN